MKAKKKLKEVIVRHVNVALFNADVLLIVSDWDVLLTHAKDILDKEKLADLTEMVRRHGKDSFTLATQFPFDGGGSLISARHGATFGTLVHEAVHAAHHLLKARKTPLAEETEEVYAYTIELIVNGLTKRIHE